MERDLIYFFLKQNKQPELKRQRIEDLNNPLKAWLKKYIYKGCVQQKINMFQSTQKFT